MIALPPPGHDEAFGPSWDNLTPAMKILLEAVSESADTEFDRLAVEVRETAESEQEKLAADCLEWFANWLLEQAKL